jgi:putative peptide zinc metalloprotease protein
MQNQLNEMAAAALGDPNEQWLEARLAARQELKYDLRSSTHDSHVVIEDPVRSKFFQVGVAEYQLMASLDGQKSIREIVAELAVSADGKGALLDDDRAVKICQWLVQNNLVFGHDVDSSKRLDTQAKMLQRAKLMGLVNPISCKLRIFNPNRVLTLIQPYTQWAFSGWVLVIWLLTGCYALATLFSNWDKLGSASAGIFSGSSWIWLLLIWIGLKVVHEAAHGIACRRFGGEVPEAGVLLLLFTPMAYVNVTSMWRFANRWHRIVVASAGMYVELFISFVSIIIWQRFPGVVGDIAFDVFIMSSVTTILFNANPLMRFDGYFILSDLLKVPNLYTKGTKWFGDRIKSLYFGVPKTPNICASTELGRVAVYGSLAFFWKITICFSLIIGASVLFYGAGLILAAIGVVLWFVVPIANQIKGLFGPAAPFPVNRRRLAISLTLTAIVGFSMFSVLKAPASKSAPAIVQFSDEQILRANAEGFIREILIENGQAVTKDQALIVLENRQLALGVRELEALANEALIESRIHANSDELALSQAALEKHEGLQRQLVEKRQQLDGLTLRAPFAGFVYQRNLENRLGSYAKRGDSLLSLAHADTKEVVVSIDQRDLESIKENVGKCLRVAFPGMDVFESELVRINPRASADPKHPSLCANAGGPLPVKPVSASSDNDEARFELLVPRFTVELELAPEFGKQLHSGQRGRAFFATNRQSLGSYLFVAASEWLEQKIDMATQTAVF